VSASPPFRLDETVWMRPVDGVNTAAGTLAEQFPAQPTLFYFLRHFG